MDILTFISNLIDAAVWPAAVIFLVFLLRSPLGRLLPLVSSLKYKDLELQFGNRLKEIGDSDLPRKDHRQRLPLDSQPQLWYHGCELDCSETASCWSDLATWRLPTPRATKVGQQFSLERRVDSLGLARR